MARRIHSVPAGMLVASSLLLAACAGDSNVDRVEAPVTALSVGDPGDVSAMALARGMLRAGFSREEILELGPSIRRGLTTSGGAQARRDGEIIALFSHMDGMLYVTSGNTGTFAIEA